MKHTRLLHEHLVTLDLTMAAQSSVMTAPSPVTKTTSTQGAYTKAPHVLPPAVKNQDGSTGSALREEMMRLYAVQEMNRRRLDELVNKVAGEHTN